MSSTTPDALALHRFVPKEVKSVDTFLAWVITKYAVDKEEDDGTFFQAAHVVKGEPTTVYYLPFAQHIWFCFLQGLTEATFSSDHEWNASQRAFVYGNDIRRMLADLAEDCSHPEYIFPDLEPVEVLVDALPFVSFRGHPLWSRLCLFDLGITTHEGVSLYSQPDSLVEIRRHHEPETENDFGVLIDAINALPPGVYVEW